MQRAGTGRLEGGRPKRSLQAVRNSKSGNSKEEQVGMVVSQVEACGAARAAKRVRATVLAEDELSRADKWVLDATRPNCFCKDATSALPVPVLR